MTEASNRTGLRADLASAIGEPLRQITRRSPDLVAKTLLHLHRALIGDRQVMIDHGGFRICVNPQDNCGGSLYYRGSYEPRETEYFLSLLQTAQPTLFVDVGANIGYYTLLAASRGVPRVVSFEPSPTIADSLERSVRANLSLRERIEVRRHALSDHAGTLQFWPNLLEHNFGTGSVVPIEATTDNQSIAVECRTGDEVLSEYRQERLLLKLDIEGGEYSALKGLSETARTVRPTILMEVHPHQLRLLGHDADDLLHLLRDLEFRIWRLVDGAEIELPPSQAYGSEVGWIVARRD